MDTGVTMNIREAIDQLQTLQDEHGGDLRLVDPDGDVIQFTFIPARDHEYDFPENVILVDYDNT